MTAIIQIEGHIFGTTLTVPTSLKQLERQTVDFLHNKIKFVVFFIAKTKAFETALVS